MHKYLYYYDIINIIDVYIFYGVSMIEYPNGPWKELFVGIYDDYSLKIFFNEEGFIISEILNSEKTKAVLYVSQISGIFGDSEAFIESLPRNAVFLLMHSQNNKKYLLLLGDQEVVAYDQKDIADFINEQFSKLRKDIKNIISIANSYEINFKEYSELPLEYKKGIFSNPLNLFSFITVNKNPKSHEVSKVDNLVTDCFLGYYKITSEQVLEPCNLFMRTYVFGKENKNLKRILLENFLLNKMNVVIFSSDSDLSNVKYPNESKEAQDKNKIAPIGFPMISYNLGEKIYCNLLDLPENVFCEVNEINTPLIKDLINKVIFDKKPNTIDNLIKALDSFEPDDKFSSYNINLAKRIIYIIKQKYPGVYLGDISVSEYFKEQNKNLGAMHFINLSDDLYSSRLIIYNYFKKLLEKEENIVIFFDNITKYFTRTNTDLLTKSFFELLAKNNSKHYVLFAENEIDILPEFLDKSTAKLSVLDDNEVGITLKDAKPFRFILRPKLSK